MRRLALLGVILVVALSATASALAFDCIRVSSSLQGLQASTRSGNWLLFDLGSAGGVQQTLAGVFGLEVTTEQASCFADAYGASGQPLYFALGIGVAGGKKESVPEQGARTAGDGWGVIAWNANEAVLGDGRGIDHIEDGGIVPAVLEAAVTCGIELPDEEA